MDYRLAIWLNFAVWATITVVFLLGNAKFEYVTRWWLRSNSALYIFFGTAAAIILYNIYHLSTADFGQYKSTIFVIFLLGILGAIAKVRDLLSVRGTAVLLLLLSHFSLKSVFLEQLIVQHCFVILQYLIIIAAMYIGAYPYILRDLRDLCLRKKCVRFICACVSASFCIFWYVFLFINHALVSTKDIL